MKCVIFLVLFFVLFFQFTQYSLHWAECSLQCTVCSVQWAVCNVHCIVCTVHLQCTVYSVQCTVCSVQVQCVQLISSHCSVQPDCDNRYFKGFPFPTYRRPKQPAKTQFSLNTHLENGKIRRLSPGGNRSSRSLHYPLDKSIYFSKPPPNIVITFEPNHTV